jgi:hypothetical protein
MANYPTQPTSLMAALLAKARARKEAAEALTEQQSNDSNKSEQTNLTQAPEQVSSQPIKSNLAAGLRNPASAVSNNISSHDSVPNTTPSTSAKLASTFTASVASASLEAMRAKLRAAAPPVKSQLATTKGVISNEATNNKTVWLSDKNAASKLGVSLPSSSDSSSSSNVLNSLASSPTGGLSALDSLRARLSAAANKQAKDAGTLAPDEEIVAHIEVVSDTNTGADNTTDNTTALGMHGEVINYNAAQQAFIDIATKGESCVLIGAAGTGKTTCSKGGINGLIASNRTNVMQSDGHRHLVDGTPSVLIISYTRRAVNNIRKVQSTDMQTNCITSHKLLEYAPEYYEIEDEATGTVKKTMQFLPTRNAQNPLSNTITTIVVEEASMLSLELYTEICNALAHEVQWIFIGDIQQLPPVFGSAILGYKMVELPCIELTEVYRQAMESPIIKLAHRILSGKPIPAAEYESWNVAGKLTLKPWKKKLSADDACNTLGAFFKAAIKGKVYDPEEDIILIPYNKACGTIEVNNTIANFLAKERGALTYEIMAGFNKHYYSVGDRVLYDREDADIIFIESNVAYTGGKIQRASKHLDYWGFNPKLAEERAAGYADFEGGVDVDFLLDSVASTEDRVTQGSHKMTLRLLDSGREITIDKAADINNLILGYALTVHKSQGSEWRKVFFCLHSSHATMLQRELLYTGVTRAREELFVICEPESFTKGIASQKIKGNTLAEKAEFFKGKMERA